MRIKKLLTVFDRAEDMIRAGLSRIPIVYALIGAVGIILLWKGVWELAEYIPGLWGPGSVIAGIVILLLSGLLVSFFIGDSIIMSGIKHEKKLAERADKDLLRAEANQTQEFLAKLEHIEHDIEQLRR